MSQVYLQSGESVMSEAYVRPPDELQSGKDQLFRLLKPLYGLTDSDNYWNHTCLVTCAAQRFKDVADHW